MGHFVSAPTQQQCFCTEHFRDFGQYDRSPFGGETIRK
jgi:hypothetical protein